MINYKFNLVTLGRWCVRFRQGSDAEGFRHQGQHEGEGGRPQPPGPAGHRQQPDGRHHQPHPWQEGGGSTRPEPGCRHEW
jgi:hypothetical protein